MMCKELALATVSVFLQCRLTRLLVEFFLRIDDWLKIIKKRKKSNNAYFLTWHFFYHPQLI
jgi:hypothetical protein